MDPSFGRLARFWRRLHPGRNPLSRRLDRLEARLLVAAMITAILALPIAAAIGSTTYANETDTVTKQAPRHSVSATLLRDAPRTAPAAEGTVASPENRMVPARWTLPGSTVPHTGDIMAPTGADNGSSVQIWVNDRGQPVPAPLTSTDAVAGGVFTAIFAWLLVVAVLASIFATARWLFDRRRVAEWERAWASVGGDWTRY